MNVIGLLGSAITADAQMFVVVDLLGRIFGICDDARTPQLGGHPLLLLLALEHSPCSFLDQREHGQRGVVGGRGREPKPQRKPAAIVF